MGHIGKGAHGPQGTLAMGHMGNGIHGYKLLIMIDAGW